LPTWEIELDKLDREERNKYLKVQTDVEKAKKDFKEENEGVTQNNFKILQPRSINPIVGSHRWIDSRIRQPGKWRPSTVSNTH
jgi:hypothetical protein